MPLRPELASVTDMLKPNLVLTFLLVIIHPKMAKFLETVCSFYAFICLLPA